MDTIESQFWLAFATCIVVSVLSVLFAYEIIRGYNFRFVYGAKDKIYQLILFFVFFAVGIELAIDYVPSVVDVVQHDCCESDVIVEECITYDPVNRYGSRYQKIVIFIPETGEHREVVYSRASTVDVEVNKTYRVRYYQKLKMFEFIYCVDDMNE